MNFWYKKKKCVFICFELELIFYIKNYILILEFKNNGVYIKYGYVIIKVCKNIYFYVNYKINVMSLFVFYLLVGEYICLFWIF